MRIFWLFNHPAPYKVEFFNCLGKKHDLTVYFERHKETGRNAIFYSKKPLTFHAYYGHPLVLGQYNNLSWKHLKHLKQAKENYDVVLINGWRTWTERLAISYCRRHKIPYIFYINGGIPRKNENNLSFAIKDHYISKANLYMAPDETSKQYLVHYGAKEEKVLLFPYGSISESEVLAKPYDAKAVEKLRNKLDIQGQRAFVSAGFFIERKNFKRLIDIWRDMPQEYSLYLIGEGKKKKEYERIIRQYGLTNVFLRPFMDHASLFRFYRACDAFVFPSNEDIYGHVVTEAMAQGLPVFSSRHVNAAKALIHDDVNGRLVDFDNSEEVVLALCRDINPAMRVAAIETARGYTFEASAAFHDEVFTRYLESLSEERK